MAYFGMSPMGGYNNFGGNMMMNPMMGGGGMGALMTGMLLGSMMGRDRSQISPEANEEGGCCGGPQGQQGQQNQQMQMMEMGLLLGLLMGGMGGQNGGMMNPMMNPMMNQMMNQMMGGGGGSPFSPWGGGGSPYGGGGGMPYGGGGSPFGGGGSPYGGGGSPYGGGGGGSPVGGGGSTYDGATGSTDKQSLLANVRTVAQVAQSKGVDPVTAVATMLTESGGNNQATGDGGTSFGLFQLHRGGELGSMSPQQAMDPGTNANTALSVFASTQHRTGLTGGALAAAAQRPANPGQYASTVNGKMGQARQLLQESGFYNSGGGQMA